VKEDPAMKQKMLEELLRSIREGGAILRGETKASRRIVVRLPKARKTFGGTNLVQRTQAANTDCPAGSARP
jgi:hypothetical protein